MGGRCRASGVRWGLRATRVVNSRFTGRGIKVAVLDTALDLGHPDFQGRAITSQSFIAGQAVQDGNGHGTHCIGTACGSAMPPMLPRYGIAAGAQIFAGKVLSNQGRGFDSVWLRGVRNQIGKVRKRSPVAYTAILRDSHSVFSITYNDVSRCPIRPALPL